MEYLVRDFENNYHKFSYSYREIKSDYEKIKSYSNEEFLNKISEILHTTIFICWIKEIPCNNCLSDYGVIHELVHLLNNIQLCSYSLDKFRETWNNQLRL